MGIEKSHQKAFPRTHQCCKQNRSKSLRCTACPILSITQLTPVVCATSYCGKLNNKPTISRWFIEPIYGDFGDCLLVGVYHIKLSQTNRNKQSNHMFHSHRDTPKSSIFGCSIFKPSIYFGYPHGYGNPHWTPGAPDPAMISTSVATTTQDLRDVMMRRRYRTKK